MEQLFEVLGPAIILVFIAVGKLLEIVFKSKEKNPAQRRRPSRPPQKRPGSRPSSQGGNMEDVQERIRRLIMERAGIEPDEPEPEPQRRAYPKPPSAEPEVEAYKPVVGEFQRPQPPPPPVRPPNPLDNAYSMVHTSPKPSANLKKLGLGSKEDLKKAILQREILGPPLALREDQNEQW